MEDLLKLTKNYYSKSVEEKESIKFLIYKDLLQIAEEEELNYIQLENFVNIFVSRMIDNEDYEIADLITSVFKDIKINYYGIK